MSHKSDPRQYKDIASHRLSDQLEEWMKKKPIPYISNDKFSQEDIFDYRAGRLPGHVHVNQTYPWMSLGCGDSSMVALHLEAG
jgi:hypothetical protein